MSFGIFVWISLWSILRMAPSIFLRFLSLFHAADLGFKKHSRSSEILFSYFSLISARLMVPTFQILIIFLLLNFLMLSWLSWFCSYIPSPTFYQEYCIFFNVKFHFYMLAVYSYCLHNVLHFLNTILSRMYISWSITSGDFFNLLALVHFLNT